MKSPRCADALPLALSNKNPDIQSRMAMFEVERMDLIDAGVDRALKAWPKYDSTRVRATEAFYTCQLNAVCGIFFARSKPNMAGKATTCKTLGSGSATIQATRIRSCAGSSLPCSAWPNGDMLIVGLTRGAGCTKRPNSSPSPV